MTLKFIPDIGIITNLASWSTYHILMIITMLLFLGTCQISSFYLLDELFEVYWYRKCSLQLYAESYGVLQFIS